METVIELKNLTTGYTSGSDKKPITMNINTSLSKGELVCLIGPNGAGKSTLMRTISGSQKPLEGQVLLDGVEVGSIPPKKLAKKLSLVLTERVHVGMLTAYEVVALGRFPYTDWSGKLKESDHQIIHEAIVMAGATELADRPLSELSDGERQKVMVARAFAQEPEIMILDEVTAFLDLPRRVEIMRLLRKMANESDKAILLSTHDMDLALRGADRIWLLPKDGKMQFGAPEDLVLNGAFQQAFATEGMHFDNQSGAFKIHESYNTSVSLKGDGDAISWTQRALERNGMEVKQDAKIQIDVKKGAEQTRWVIHQSGTEREASSIYEVILVLKEMIRADVAM